MYDDVDVRPTLIFHFVYQRCHTVYSGISRRYHYHLSALFGKFECLLSPFALLLHAGVDTFRMRGDETADKLEVVLIADDDVGSTECLPYCHRHVFNASGTYPDNN